MSIGDESRIGDNVRIEVKGGQVSIGRGCLINDNCVITAWTSVTLCDHTRIAPFCLITDRNHGLNRNALIVEQEGIKEPVVIEEDVWIASSCVVLPGVRIQRGAVVGANSVVNRSVLPATIVAGSPANKIGSRR
ncbi:MAG: acyltransferase [Verrucomicrobia bacterium]|nr:acyltransferase [Verrucomicrobiota bacterium]